MIRRTICLIIGIAFLIPAAAWAGDDLNKHLTAENITKMEKGEVILFDQTYTDSAGNVRGKGLAMAMVKADKDTAWKHLNDFANYKDFMPRIIHSSIYHDAGGKLGVKYTIKVLMVKVTYHCMHTFDKPNGYIRYKLDTSKENEIAATEGYWKVFDKDGKTIIAYTVAVDTGRAIPKSIQDYLTKKDLPNVVRAAKKRIESGGTYKKD